MAYPPGGYGYPPQGGYVQETVNVTPYGVQETVVAQRCCFFNEKKSLGTVPERYISLSSHPYVP
jgi:hypothetical protein